MTWPSACGGAGYAPPTGGLPVQWHDIGWSGDADLGAALSRHLGLPGLQIECSGTAALVVALTALQQRAPGRDEVIVPAYTCPLVALAVAHCGLRLVLCDLQPASLDLDTAMLSRLCHRRTLAVLPTHLGGRVTNAAEVRRQAEAAGASTIEDAAQALGARLHGGSVGADSDLAFFSLAVGKGLTTFEGGVLYARDAALRAACREVSRTIAPFRFGWEALRSLQLLALAAAYRPPGLRRLYEPGLRRAVQRGDWVAAAGDDFAGRIPLHRMGRWRQRLAVKALRRLPAFQQAQRVQALRRIERLQRIPGVRVLQDSPAAAQGTWPVLLVVLPRPAARDALLRALWPGGWGVSLPFVHALPDYPAYAHCVPPAPAGSLPNARDLAARLLAVSNSAWLEEARFEQVCSGIEQALHGGG